MCARALILPMKILVVHNRYRLPGGEDEVAAAETALLRRKGHDVETYLEDNRRIGGLSVIQAGLESVWSRSSYRKVRDRLREFRPDIVHCHNTFPLISPSIYFACEKERIPVVQSLHNPRLMCPAACLSRNSQICERCVGKTRLARRRAWLLSRLSPADRGRGVYALHPPRSQDLANEDRRLYRFHRLLPPQIHRSGAPGRPALRETTFPPPRASSLAGKYTRVRPLRRPSQRRERPKSITRIVATVTTHSTKDTR